MLQEARAAAALQHANVCTIYEIDESYPYLVMEFVGGQTLKERIAEGPLPFEEAIGIACGVAAGLQAAHSTGIVHRDIKPANILLNTQSEPKISDFGLARLAENTLTIGIIAGTPAYMAPEQLNGSGADRRSDIWAFGLILHEMLTGRLPGPGSLDPLPAEAHRIVRKCLSLAPSDRYQHADELVMALRARVLRRNPGRRLYWLAAIAAIVLVAAVVSFSVPRGTFPGGGQSVPSSSNAAAEEAFLRGRFLASRDDKEQQKQGLTLLERAVELDPGFAQGYAALARAYTNHYFIANPTARPELEPKAYAAVEKAMSLNPNLADAYVARALLVWTPSNGFPHQRAIRDLRRAIKLSPSAEARRILARIYFHVGLPERGLEETRQAAALESDLAEISYSDLNHRPELALCLASMGRHEQALEEWGRSAPMTMHPFNAMNMAWSLVTAGRIRDARKLIENLAARVGSENENAAAAQAIILAAERKRKPAQQQIAIALSKESELAGHFHHIAFFAACVYARLADTDNALRWLKYTAEGGFPNVALFESAPDLESVRQDPRYQSLLTRWKAHASEMNAID
jgi:tetratricopeptide (TPR) repeat protein